MRVCVYTAIYGGYDELKPPAPQSAPTDFVCFTDSATLGASGAWRIVQDRRLPDLHPRMRAKWFKTHPHALFPAGRPAASQFAPFDPRRLLRRYDCIVWIDGSIRVTGADFARDMLASLGDAGLAFIRHPDRDCIYDEADESLRWGKYVGQPIAEQVEHYRREGYPPHHGLMAGGVIARRPGTAALPALDEAWWQENLRWTYQDQLSLPVVLWRQGFSNVWIPGNLWSNPWYRWEPHRNEEGRRQD